MSAALSITLTFFSGLRGLSLVAGSILGSGLMYVVAHAIIGLARPARIELRQPTDLPMRFREGPRE